MPQMWPDDMLLDLIKGATEKPASNSVIDNIADRGIKMPISQEELQRRATYHPPTPKAVGLHEDNRNRYLDYATFITASIPDCREASVAQTNLEQVMFWVNAAIARNHEKL